MCGIAGVKRFGDKPIDIEWVKTLLVSMQHRGMDSTGLAWVNDGETQLHHVKVAEPAWKFVTNKDVLAHLAEFFGPQTRTVICHTRAATKGNPQMEKNNHPLVHGGVAIVHNGIIYNDDTLFRELKLERHAETDSDIIRAILDNEGLTKAGIRRLGRLAGSAAIAALDPAKPGHLLLVRSGNPLVIAKYEEDYIVWASEKHCINKAMRREEDRFGITWHMPVGAGAVQTMVDNTGWLFGPNGLEWHDEVRIAVSYSEPRRHVYDNYNARQLRWANELKEKQKPAVQLVTNVGKTNLLRIKCPHCKAKNALNEERRRLPMERLICGSCNKPLVAES